MQQKLIINHPSSIICHPSSVLCLLPSVFCLLRPSTSVEDSLQISSFMQNKPNFRKSQMNVKSYNTKDYENKRNWTIGQSKPNSNPILSAVGGFQKAKMNVNLYFIVDYRKKDDFIVRINKPNLVRRRRIANERKSI